MDRDLVIGTHSIAEVIKNNNRKNVVVYCTKEALADFKKIHRDAFDCGRKFEVSEFKTSHNLQSEAKKIFTEMGFNYKRVPGNIFCLTDKAEFQQIGTLFDKMKDRNDLKILCLDQVTDIHNSAAIIRTASFYGVNAVVLPGKNTSGVTPGFFRNSCGGYEHLDLFFVSSLSKFVSRSRELGCITIGFSEHSAHENFKDEALGKNTILILGNEEKGISNALSRNIEYFTSIKPKGKTKSLNVSVACAIAFEKFFGSD
ncbi:MAG: hypothetical protein CME61_06465 [Halobacteriovoraceae bacterium]|nr:hypothetical protein [Halobacteriovoraceae bacterium]